MNGLTYQSVGTAVCPCCWKDCLHHIRSQHAVNVVVEHDMHIYMDAPWTSGNHGSGEDDTSILKVAAACYRYAY